MSFRLKKIKPILICGNNIRTSILLPNLEKQGFRNVTVTNSRLEGFNGNVKNTILFIAFQNALQHDDVAESMYQQGFNDMLFLPTQGCINDKKADLMRRVYNSLLYGCIDENILIPSYDEVKNRALRIENGIINNEFGMVTFWARLESIFVNNVCIRKNQCGLQYYGVNLMLVEHYRSLFELMEGKEERQEHLKEYFETQSYLDAEGNIIKEKMVDRYQLFLMYKREINKGMDFFISSASIVEGNEYGGLHIKEGLHRAVFLMTQNLAYIPVMMSEKEFNKRYSNGVLEKVQEFFMRKGIKKTVTPVAHPAFYSFPAEKENREPSVLMAVIRFLGIRGITGKRILDMSDYNSYFARNVGRMSCKNAAAEIESWENDETSLQLACLYNELLNIRNVNVLSGFAPVYEKEYDIVFVMGNHGEIFRNDKFLRKLGENTKEILFFETDISDVELQKEMIMTEAGFVKYIALHRYFDGLMKRELGVFLKEG